DCSHISKKNHTQSVGILHGGKQRQLLECGSALPLCRRYRSRPASQIDPPPAALSSRRESGSALPHSKMGLPRRRLTPAPARGKPVRSDTMVLPDHSWKIAGVGALLGVMGTLFAAREPVATVREALASPSSAVVSVQGQVQVLRPNQFVLRDATGAVRLDTC